MQCSLSWAICGLLCVQSVTALAQQSDFPIRPNYGRTSQVALNLPAPDQSIDPIGSGVSPTVIPQQGSVDLGTGAVKPALPNYSYSSQPACEASGAASPALTSSTCPDNRCVNDGCTHCGSSSCVGGCRFKLGGHGHGKLLGHDQHHSGGWFGGLYFMRLWRADDNINFGRSISVNDTDPTQSVMWTGQAHAKEMDGFGIRIGKMINACSAIEFIYWQVFPDDITAFTNATAVGAGITTPLNFGSLTYDPGTGAVPVSDFFTDSGYVSVTRSYDYRNFELNFLRLPFLCGGNPCSKARLAVLAGPRYFRIEEGLSIFSDDLNEIPGDDPLNELSYDSETENHLVGFQIGALLDYRLCRRLSVQIGSKAGIYNNRMKHTQVLGGGAGSAIVGAGPFAPQPYALETKKDDLAFLGELDAGASYCVKQNLRITGGYKLLAVSGYANPVSQIPIAFDNFNTAGLIYDDDSLILHGFYVGGEYCW